MTVVYKVHVLRHGAFSRGGYPARLGLLTMKGVDESIEAANHVIKSALGENILILYSPTRFEDQTGKKFGCRGKHTAEVLAENFRPRFRVCGLFDLPELAEPNIYYIETAAQPRAYIEAQTQRFGRDGRWEAYHRGDPDIDAIGQRIGAQTAVDYSLAVGPALNSAFLHADSHEALDIVLVTHNDFLREVAQRYMGADESAYDYNPGTGECLDLTYRDGTVEMEFRGEVYTRTL